MTKRDKNTEIKRFANVVLKIAFSFGSLFYLIYLLGFEKKELVRNVAQYFKAQDFSYILPICVFTLMLVNWGTEVIKWRSLIRFVFPMSWGFAVKTQLASIAGSIFTPYRVGSYVGKIALLPFKARAKGLVLQLFNAVGMFIVNFFYGSLSLFFLLLYSTVDIFGVPSFLLAILAAISVIVTLMFWVLFPKVEWILGVFDKIKFTKKWRKYFDVLGSRDFKKVAVKILFWSNLRYIVIVTQYYLSFQLFAIEIPFLSLVFASGALFFLFQFLPVFNAVELGLSRTALFSLILVVFGLVPEVTPQMTVAITSASFFIWLINLALPSVFGAIALRKIKVFKP